MDLSRALHLIDRVSSPGFIYHGCDERDELEEGVASLVRKLAAHDEAVARVREIHAPDRPLASYPDCRECTTHGYCEDDGPVEWPCPTVRALDAALSS